MHNVTAHKALKNAACDTYENNFKTICQLAKYLKMIYGLFTDQH